MYICMYVCMYAYMYVCMYEVQSARSPFIGNNCLYCHRSTNTITSTPTLEIGTMLGSTITSDLTPKNVNAALLLVQDQRVDRAALVGEESCSCIYTRLSDFRLI